jgi:CheY-like chemotaxis protein
MIPATPTPSAPVAYLVDDEPMLLDLNETVLRGLGFEVRRFRAAEQALEAYQSDAVRPAIIVTDYSMHRMTGLELIEACRRLDPNQKILLVSGTVDSTVFRHAAHKPDQFIPKPYSTDKLAEVVQSLVGKQPRPA